MGAGQDGHGRGSIAADCSLSRVAGAIGDQPVWRPAGLPCQSARVWGTSVRRPADSRIARPVYEAARILKTVVVSRGIRSIDRRRLLQSAVLVAGLVGVAFVIWRTVDDARGQVMPSPLALTCAGVLTLVTILSSGRAWTALFTGFLDDRRALMGLRGTFYLSQLTKYLPAGGLVQAASQMSMASAAGVPLGRVAVAFPVSAVCTIAAGATFGVGLVFDSSLPGWVRALGAVGLAAPVLLHRRLMAAALGVARRLVPRIPESDRLPSQRDILAAYGWAVLGIGAFAVAYAVLLGSITDGARPVTVVSAFAVSWVIGFLAVPIPAGIGVREVVLVALLPGIGAAPLLAASLALRLLAIAAELLAVAGNRMIVRRRSASPPGRAPVASRRLSSAQRPSGATTGESVTIQ